MRSEEIRRRFLQFFEQRGHTVVPSASLIADDPTLLLINAGMAPFKPYFLGQSAPPFPRAASIQKCVRTIDIELVGTTKRHESFFEMAGNFSFGDYFKELAIPHAWQLMTDPLDAGGYGLDPDRLWVTIYEQDDEAYDIWTRSVGFPAERLQRLGKADNYWSMGVPGPCGPCSELCYDRGPQYGVEGGPAVDGERYVEVWNLVFMQYVRGPGIGYDYEVVGDLPACNIDTGLGVDRLAAILQGVDGVFETDLLGPVVSRAGVLTGHTYGADARADVRLRVIADHTRTATMLIADGVVPSNEARGYVLRRLLRRAIRDLRLLGCERPVITELVAAVRDTMSPGYPELVRDFDRIQGVAAAEEQSFLSTLRTGSALFDEAVRETRERGANVLAAERAFTLHDTYGFPLDVTLEMAAEAGLTVDEEGFRRLMDEQRHRAQQDARQRKEGAAGADAYRELLEQGGPTAFLGYSDVRSHARVTGLLRDGVPVPAAAPGEEVLVSLDRTPFYAEAGGQQADHGVIRLADGTELEVLDVQRPVPDLVVHLARVRGGEATVGEAAYAEVDVDRRRAISRAHTATHLVHQAVRRALGEQAAQAGSMNAPGRLRFDFSAPGAVSHQLLRDVEEEVNEVLIRDLPVRAFVTSMDEARRIGAIALFGEKYGDAVRVVEVGDYARELCGGTHAARSGHLGVVKLLAESSIGAGVRRVEGLVGLDAFRYLARESVLVDTLAGELHANRDELVDRLRATLTRLREAERELERLRAADLLASAPTLAERAAELDGVRLVVERAPDGTAVDDLRTLALDVRGRLGADRPAVVGLAAVTERRPVVVVAVNDPARERGVRAGDLVRAAAAALGGGGGGRDDLAQGGGSNPEALPAALAALRTRVAETVGS